jgi:hypothetical protein
MEIDMSEKEFDNNYMATLTLHDSPVGRVPVAGVETMQEYIDYFFHNFPIVGYKFYEFHTYDNKNSLTVWGNRWPVEVVIRELENVTVDVERLS